MAQGAKRIKQDEQEFGRAKKDLVLCSSCGIVYFKKSWHHNFRHFNETNKDKRVAFTICPACKMAANNQYEGHLTVLNIPQNKKEQFISTIKNSGMHGYRRDPLDRILRTEVKNNSINVYTSENQLAVRIGKKLRTVFGGDLKIRYSKEDQLANVEYTA
jgi:NMD protein affecting ribosome stability and mRNA decay